MSKARLVFIFSVAINGQTVLSNFDIFQAAGGADIAISTSFTVNVGSSQSIFIDFLPGSAQNPTINAIEITGAP